MYGLVDEHSRVPAPVEFHQHSASFVAVAESIVPTRPHETAKAGFGHSARHATARTPTDKTRPTRKPREAVPKGKNGRRGTTIINTILLCFMAAVNLFSRGEGAA